MVYSGLRRRPRGIAAVFLSIALATLLIGPQPAGANHGNVTAVTGSAFGYWSDGISLFGGVQPDFGPTPTVALAANASNSPQSTSVNTGLVSYGPARLFTSDTITLNTSGSIGPSGSVTTTSNISNVNYADTQAASTGSEIFGYPPPEVDPAYINFNPNNLRTSVAGSATATESGWSGSTTITNGMLRTDAQSSVDCAAPIDTTPCGRAGEAHTHNLANPEGVVTIPSNPPPNYTVAGHLHLGSTTTDYFVIVFNEQTVNPDGSITVTPVHEYFGYKLVNGVITQDLQYAQGGSILHGHLYLGQVTAGVTVSGGYHPPPPNFDGDNDTDRAVFRNGTWFAEGQAPGFLGQAGDIPVPADYDGDGDSERAVYRNGTWFIDGQSNVFHGLASDVPVPADYDGDGDDDVAVYRPSVGGWFILNQPTVFYGGFANDIAVPADYDGDGGADPAVWRPGVGGWYVEGQTTQFIGLSGDIPVPGDYDGNGDAERGVWRPQFGGWYIEGQAPVFIGLNGDRPVPGDYDGDGDTERGVWRPAFGGWYVDGQATVFLGLSNDVPLSLPNSVYRHFF